MSGGIEETLPLDDKNNEKAKGHFWDILNKTTNFYSLMGASIEPDPYSAEFQLSNGLVKVCLFGSFHFVDALLTGAWSIA